jgi:hypothetical protein
MNKNICNFFKQINSVKNYNNKIIFTILVSFILIMTTTPIILAASEDSVVITFDPNGDIDIDVNLGFYNFSSVIAGMWANSTGGTFTLYNNGSVPMDTQIKTNATTDSTELSLNASGVPPQQDEYAIYIDGLDVENYLTTAYNLEFDQGLASNDLKTFDICLLLGVNLSANFSWQTTTIYFQGSIS